MRPWARAAPAFPPVRCVVKRTLLHPRVTVTVPPALAGDGAAPPPPPRPPRAPAARHTRGQLVGWGIGTRPAHPFIHTLCQGSSIRLRRTQHVPAAQTLLSGVCAARLDVCPAHLIRRPSRSTLYTFASAMFDCACGCEVLGALGAQQHLCVLGRTLADMTNA